MDTSTSAVAKETKATVEPKVQKQATREEPAAAVAKPAESAATTKPSKSGASSLKTAQNEQNKPAAFSTPSNSKQPQKQTSVAKPAPAQNSTNVNTNNQIASTAHTDLNRLPARVNTPQKSHSDHHLVSNADFQFQFLKQIDVISDKNFIKIVNYFFVLFKCCLIFLN
jgi:hypothetical protein